MYLLLNWRRITTTTGIFPMIQMPISKKLYEKTSFSEYMIDQVLIPSNQCFKNFKIKKRNWFFSFFYCCFFLLSSFSSHTLIKHHLSSHAKCSHLKCSHKKTFIKNAVGLINSIKNTIHLLKGTSSFHHWLM